MLFYPAMSKRPRLPWPAVLLLSAAAVFLASCVMLIRRAPPSAFEQNARLGRGINLGNALEAPTEGEWGVTLKPEYYRLIKEAGFRSVRIPVRWPAHAHQGAPYLIDPAFFARVDWAVQQALSNGLAAVVNIHHYDDLVKDPAAQRERFLALWRQIAEHYQGYPDQLLLEILNEPNSQLTAELWNQFLGEALEVIRAADPRRTVVVDAANWASTWELGKLVLPEGDRNLIVSFHFYSPFEFTHQGAEWVSGSGPWLGRTWAGTESNKQEIIKAMDVAAEWGKKNNRPLFMGEFGAYSKADMDSRVRWTGFVARQAEERDFSWAYWEFCSGFGAYDPAANAWREGLLRALIPSR
ncbi:MAG: glycoside hydrolase family 5 protein [Verrucomicrobiota bacterium]